MKFNLIFLLIIIFPILSHSQDSTKYRIVELENTKTFSIDRYDNIFRVNNNQDIIKLNDDDKLLYSSTKRKEITHIEAWNSLRLFIFNREYQEYTLLDKYLSEISITPFNSEEIGYVSYSTLALDGNIWAVDNSDFSLKKMDIRNNSIINSTNLNFILEQGENEILFMKERGNFLYISTKSNGILVFDNLGTFKKKIPFDEVNFFSFKGNEIYFTSGNKLIFFNLISLNSHFEILIKHYSKVLIIKNNLYLIE